MRNNIFVILALFMLVACSSKPYGVHKDSIAGKCLLDSPKWVIDGKAETGLTSVGAAKVGQAGIQFARTVAIANARDEMARTISVKVNNMLKNFTQSTGIGSDEVVDQVYATVSKQVTSQTLSGTSQQAIWLSPCDEIYVLINNDIESVEKIIKNTVTSSYKNDKALWVQFQAQKAQEELDAAIEKEFGY